MLCCLPSFASFSFFSLSFLFSGLLSHLFCLCLPSFLPSFFLSFFLISCFFSLWALLRYQILLVLSACVPRFPAVLLPFTHSFILAFCRTLSLSLPCLFPHLLALWLACLFVVFFLPSFSCLNFFQLQKHLQCFCSPLVSKWSGGPRKPDGLGDSCAAWVWLWRDVQVALGLLAMLAQQSALMGPHS